MYSLVGMAPESSAVRPAIAGAGGVRAHGQTTGRNAYNRVLLASSGIGNRVAVHAKHSGLAPGGVRQPHFSAMRTEGDSRLPCPITYQVPALMLTALLLPAFGYLYLRFRNTRTLLWFLGFLFRHCPHAALLQAGAVGLFSADTHPWLAATSQMSIQISSALFLASLSPLRFRVGRFQYPLRHSLHDSAGRLLHPFLWGFPRGIAREAGILCISRAGSDLFARGLLLGRGQGQHAPPGWAFRPAPCWAASRFGFVSHRERPGR